MAKKKEIVGEDGLVVTPPDQLDFALLALEKEFGKGVVFSPRRGTSLPNVEKISSGSFKLNQALGGGYPLKRIVEIFGPESSGKSTLCLHAVAEAQKAAKIPGHPWYGRKALYSDVEHALDVEYARNLGVDTDDLLISQPDNGEQALAVVDTLMRSGRISVAVVDSVASLVTKAELEGEISDSHVGRQARLMSQSLKILSPMVSNTNSLLIFTNQIRMKVGVMFGSPETTSGGQALKFYASQRLDIRRVIGDKDSNGEVLSVAAKVTVVKNKVAPPFRKAELDLEFGRGLNTEAEVLDLCVERELILKSGAWYSFFGENGVEERLAQGRVNAIKRFRDEPELLEAFKNDLLNHMNMEAEEASGD